MNLVAPAPEGLEKYLAKEISNLGGFNINTYKRFIIKSSRFLLGSIVQDLGF